MRLSRRAGIAATCMAVASLTACIPVPVASTPTTPAVSTPAVSTPIDPVPDPPTPTPTPTPTATPGPPPPASLGPTLTEGSGPSGIPYDQPGDLIVMPSIGVAGELPPDWGFDDSAAEYDAPALVASTSGVLVSTFPDDTTISCSATVVHSDSHDVAVTAAHCVHHSVDGVDAVSMRFTPGVAPGSPAPFGTWTVTDAVVADEYFVDLLDEDGQIYASSAAAHDVAFLTIAEQGGVSIEDRVGGQGIAFVGQMTGVLGVGYPLAEPFDGSSLRACSEVTPADSEYLPQLRIQCAATNGVSGGAWLTALDEGSGGAFAVAVFSRDDVNLNRYGAVFGAVAQALYESVQG